MDEIKEYTANGKPKRMSQEKIILEKLKKWINENAKEFEDNPSCFVLVEDIEDKIQEWENECVNEKES